MEIHKPKPWHGPREFFGEILIIVIGVLIALGAEQAVETLHWREKVSIADVQEQEELRVLYLNALDRDRTESCLNARLDQLKTQLLSGAGRWRPLPQMKGVAGQSATIIVPRRDWPNEVWRSLVADGTASHFSRERELTFAQVYAQANWLEENNRAEVADASALNVLNDDVDLSPDMRVQLVTRIEQEKTRIFYMAIASRQLMAVTKVLADFDQASIARSMLSASNTYRACASVGLLPPGSPPPTPIAADDRSGVTKD